MDDGNRRWLIASAVAAAAHTGGCGDPLNGGVLAVSARLRVISLTDAATARGS
ncbi:hypothetical protein [Longimicrobium terrae]|uniref:Uncharacterized protein n=1 Tax=Longimicrobium terrae TaxID=1639882 RepID=A0A841GVC2_9BACT|nr:hypothetical protein [Longimicrobium terrae]MBB4634939.1 hypothetical protein [Longimicrobium terrae]MBB6069334.1 hypothetical protein [Longimicrobium terrae]NNC31858.1 hypothetical protein [Longimicrobium terrae]